MYKKLSRSFMKLIALFLIVFLFSTNLTFAASDTVTYTNAAQVAQLVSEGYNKGEQGPIIVTKGTLNTGSSSKDVYVITLSGTELVFNQSTEYITDLFSGFNLKSAYYYNVVKVIKNKIPKGSNLILAGHSLGGMIAQQVAADTSVKYYYNVLNVVTFGSPLLAYGFREGTIRRLGDISDFVPLLSTNTVITPIRALTGLNRENGGYYFKPITAHKESYTREDVWGKYDVTGTKYGKAKLTLDLSTKTFYPSPILG